MKIRWKLLILLLVLSLAPLLVLRLMGEKAMRELGDDLASRSQKMLVENAMVQMRRMVEGQAEVMGRERDVLELTVCMQGLLVENALSRPVPDGEEPFFRNEGMQGRPMRGMSGFAPSMRHSRSVTEEATEPASVSMDRFVFSRPHMAPQAAFHDEAAKIDALAPEFKSLQTGHSDLILWQTVTLVDGLHAVFPAFLPESAGFPDPRRSQWYGKAMASDKPVWSRPEVSPATRRILMRLACRVRDGNATLGVTSLVLPLSDVLAANPHTQAVSSDMRILLVRPGNATSDSLDVIGLDHATPSDQERDMRHGMARRWLVPVEPQTISAPAGTPLAPILADIAKGASGVRRIMADGNDEIWAYGVLDQYKTSLVMIAPTSDVTHMAEEARTFVVERIKRQILYSGLILGGVAMMVFVVAFITSRAVTTPLRQVANAVRQVAAGDWDTRVDLKSCDEIGDLACTFNEMIPQLHERYEMKAALDVAHEVQRSLLPKQSPEVNNVDVAGVIRYCDETGGDYYDFLPSASKDIISLAVGDVTGHGIPAALLMAAARAYVRSRADKHGTPAEIVADVNRLVTEDCWETNRFMTMFYMEVNGPERTVRWVRAGHDPAMVYNPATDSFAELKGPGMAMGLEPDAHYSDQETTLPAGAVVLVGTDGIWEAHDPTGEQFGYDRFRQAVRENAQATAEEVALAVTDAVAAFQGDAPREDDITLVVVKFA